jgi:hypothetical protein
MRWSCALRRVAALSLFVGVESHLVQSSPSVDLRRDGALNIAGRALRCGAARNVLDPGLRNLGLAAPGVVVFNPFLLNRQPDTVRLFVFHHECGHHHVGASETGADCWAVKQGVRQGWLDRQGLVQVCRSFGNGPATPTHPSGARRCASLEQCFANASAVTTKPSSTEPARTSPDPKLITGPTLVRDRPQRSLQ